MDELKCIVLVNWERLPEIRVCAAHAKQCALETENKTFRKGVGTYLAGPSAS